MGGIQRNQSGYIIKAGTEKLFFHNYIEAILLAFVLNSNPENPLFWRGLVWEEFFKRATEQETVSNNILIYHLNGQSQRDEVDRATKTDRPLYVIAVMAMIIYVTLALGRIHPISSKVLLGLSGIKK